MPDVMSRAEMAIKIGSNRDYDDEYDADDSLLSLLVREGVDGVSDDDLSGVGRYLMIATENAGNGPGDAAEFFTNRSAASIRMGEYACEGWVSSLYDLDADTIDPIKERAPR